MSQRNPYYSGPPSDHFDGHVFFNPDGRPPSGLGDLLRWQFGRGRRRAQWPSARQSPVPPAKPAVSVDGDALRVTMVGHSTMLLQVAGLNILTDPVWSPRASPYSFAGPKRVCPPGIGFDDLPHIDVVLVSHNHYDHLDIETLKRLRQRHDPLVVTPLGNDTIIRAAAPEMRIVVLDWQGETIVTGLRIVAEPVHHWSARGMFDRRMALWCGFVLESPAGKLFFAGDTGFDDGKPYRNVRERHGPMRLAILPIGAYAPRWFMKPQHQDPEEAVEGMRLLQARACVACHWGTFQLTDEAIDEPVQKLGQALRSRDIDPARFRVLEPGEAWDVPV